MAGLERSSPARRRSTPARGRTAWLVAGIALLAINLRPAVVAVAPLTSRVRADTGLSAAGVSLLTALPLLCFGLFALPAPRLARRIGLERSLGLAATTLAAGTALRLVPGLVALFAGSALVGAGIAIENVLLSGLVKRDFPDRAGTMMTVYTFGLSGGATAAAGLTIPLADALHVGWRPALALWGIPATLAVLVWLPVALRGGSSGASWSAGAAGTVGASGSVGPGLAAVVWRSRLAWWTAAYMATQSLVFYSLNAWLPTLLENHGVSAATAGGMLAVFNFTGLAGALVMPGLATRRASQRSLAASVACLFVIGLLGLLVAPRGGAWAWMIILGAGQGAGIGLGLTLFVLRTRGAAASAELSGMAQTVGYLIAALGPLTVGALHGITGGWTVSLLELLAVTVVLCGAGWMVGADRAVEDD